MKMQAARRYEERLILLLGLLLIVLINSNPTLSCSCNFSHPQYRFCQADYVIQAKIMRSSRQVHEKYGINYKQIYIRIKKAFKMTEKARVALKSQVLWTAAEGSLCGINLHPGHKYVISGKLSGLKAWLSLCDYVQKWSSLTRKQKKGFRMLYKHGCSCKIRHCPEYIHSCPKSKSTCRWTSMYDGRYDCQALHTYCVPQRNGLCDWNDSKVYRNCLKVRDNVKKRQREMEP